MVRLMRRRDRWQLDWPGGASSRRSVRSVARLAPLKSLLAKQSDKSLRHYLDALVDLLKRVSFSIRLRTPPFLP